MLRPKISNDEHCNKLNHDLDVFVVDLGGLLFVYDGRGVTLPLRGGESPLFKLKPDKVRRTADACIGEFGIFSFPGDFLHEQFKINRVFIYEIQWHFFAGS